MGAACTTGFLMGSAAAAAACGPRGCGCDASGLFTVCRRLAASLLSLRAAAAGATAMVRRALDAAFASRAAAAPSVLSTGAGCKVSRRLLVFLGLPVAAGDALPPSDARKRFTSTLRLLSVTGMFGNP
ncbi:pen-2 [Drosophila busckii]|uniref:Pen-2 n=1 Tax=Drosophila busckii TaxID=30019 RepID=A0A0M4EG06_DROBS|nr:pen-2 [Drosophila busckii]